MVSVFPFEEIFALLAITGGEEDDDGEARATWVAVRAFHLMVASYQHMTPNRVNRTHWPTKENRQELLIFCIFRPMEKLA